MAFAGVSVIIDGKLLEGPTAPTINAGAASGYHLLVVEGHSRTRAPPNYVRSRSFIVGGHCWSIVYFLDGSTLDNAGFISLRLFHTTSKPVKAQLEFSFVDETEKHDPARIRASSTIFEFDHWSLEGNHDRFMKRETLQTSNHLKDDSFTIRCDVLVAEEDVISACIEVPPSEMKQNFTDLLIAGEGTDVVFQVGGETIAAHRCVLAARSAVLRAALFGPMKEGTSTVVQIDDMDPTIFKAMLGFVYSDSIPAPTAEELEDGVLFQHLLVAADRYGLRRLRAMCEKRLCEHIEVGTAMTFVALAEQHGSNSLKEACYQFLRCPANLRAVLATDGFDHLCRSSPSAMKDLIVALGMPQPPKK